MKGVCARRDRDGDQRWFLLPDTGSNYRVGTATTTVVNLALDEEISASLLLEV